MVGKEQGVCLKGMTSLCSPEAWPSEMRLTISFATTCSSTPWPAKSHNHMNGVMRYMTADNRDFLLALVNGLEK